MSGRLIALGTHPGVHLVGVGETWIHLFTKYVMMVTGPKATSTCWDGQICAGLKVGTDSAVHGAQNIWDTKLTTKDWVFLLVYAKTLSTISIRLE